MLVVMSLAVASTCFASKDGLVPIPVVDSNQQNGTTHRMPARIPIEAWYDDVSSSILLTFLQDLGEADVLVLNLTTDYLAEFVIDAEAGMVTLPINGEQGIYSITFTLSSGSVYEGVFEIE